MKGYVFSVNIRTKSKSYGMKSPEYMVYADLRAAGWSMRDAWSVAFNGEGLNWDKAELEREMNKLESLASVQKRMSDLKGQNQSDTISQEELIKATSKEEILRNLVIAQRKQKFGSPDWQKTTAMIADYSKIKQDEIDTENNTVLYYLPVSYPRTCADCLLFHNGKADFQKKG